jgi:hypothetical protein
VLSKGDKQNDINYWCVIHMINYLIVGGGAGGGRRIVLRADPRSFLPPSLCPDLVRRSLCPGSGVRCPVVLVRRSPCDPM